MLLGDYAPPGEARESDARCPFGEREVIDVAR